MFNQRDCDRANGADQGSRELAEMFNADQCLEQPPVDMTQDVFLAMIASGSDFEKALGELGVKADPQNRAKIRTTWPEIYAEYAAIR